MTARSCRAPAGSAPARRTARARARRRPIGDHEHADTARRRRSRRLGRAWGRAVGRRRRRRLGAELARRAREPGRLAGLQQLDAELDRDRVGVEPVLDLDADRVAARRQLPSPANSGIEQRLRRGPARCRPRRGRRGPRRSPSSALRRRVQSSVRSSALAAVVVGRDRGHAREQAPALAARRRRTSASRPGASASWKSPACSAAACSARGPARDLRPGGLVGAERAREQRRGSSSAELVGVVDVRRRSRRPPWRCTRAGAGRAR